MVLGGQVGGAADRGGQRRRFDARWPSNMAPIGAKLCQNAFQTIPVNPIFGEKTSFVFGIPDPYPMDELKFELQGCANQMAKEKLLNLYFRAKREENFYLTFCAKREEILILSYPKCLDPECLDPV